MDLWPFGPMCECVCKENEKVKYYLGEEGYKKRERERERERGEGERERERERRERERERERERRERERERGGRCIRIFGLLG